MAQKRDFERANTAFIIPPEIFLKIMGYLDWQGLLSMKQSCKKLYALTKMRQLWYSYIKDLQNGGCPPPETPLDEYTVEELERWVLRRLRVRGQWQLPELLPFQLRQTRNYIEVGNCTLLPSGRWLVGVTPETGKFYVTDLDLREPIPYVLIDPNDSPEDPENILYSWDYAVWIDPSKPRLTFRVALFSSGTAERPRVCIYEVELQGHGPGATFIVTRLIVIANTEDADKKAQLNDSYYIEVIQYWDPGQMIELHVYSYSKPPAETGNSGPIQPIKLRTSMSTNSTVGSIYILASDRIGIMDYEFLYIFSFPQLKESNPSNVLPPLHQISLTGFSILLSQPIHLPNTTCFLVANPQEKLRMIQVPHDDTSPPIMRQVDYQANLSNVIIGLGSTSIIIFHADYSIEVVGFSWDEENDDFSIKHKRGRRMFDFLSPPRKYHFCAFEDTMGRVVLMSEDSWEILDVGN